MKNMTKKEYEKIFPDCKYGRECSKKIGKFIVEYKLEKTKNRIDYDHIIFRVEDYKEPIPHDILRDLLRHFEPLWSNMYWEVTLKDTPYGGRDDYIQYTEVLDDHTHVYYIDFHQLDDLKFLKYILYGIALEQYK